MKTCKYCWRDNKDDATHCIDCGKPIPSSTRQNSGQNFSLAALLPGNSVVLIMTAVAAVGWLLVVVEHSKKVSAERRCTELESKVGARDAAVADAESRLRKLEARNKSQAEELSELNIELLRQRNQCATLKRELEDSTKRLTELAAASQNRGNPWIKPVDEGPLATDVRLQTGAPLEEFAGQGNGELEVVNHLRFDAVIKLVRPFEKKSLAAFYLRSGDTYLFPGIPDGSYTLYYATGYDYDVTTKDFRRGRKALKCDSPFLFTTRITDRSIIGRKQRFELGVAFGNTTSSPVSAGEFDQYAFPR